MKAAAALLVALFVGSTEGRLDSLFGTAAHANADITFDWTQFVKEESTNVTNTQGQVVVEGGGNLYSSTLMDDALFIYNAQSLDRMFDIKYRIVGTGDATICRLQGYLSHCKHPFVEYGGNFADRDVAHPVFMDFAVDDRILLPEVYEATPDVKLYPLAATAVVPIFNIPGLTKLVLTKAVLARMFRGCDDGNPECVPNSIRTWAHPDILALNPNSTHAALQAAGPIQRFVYSIKSGVTRTLKQALMQADSNTQTQFASLNTNLLLASASWPGVENLHLSYLGYGVGAQVLQTPGALGYTELDTATHLRVTAISLMQDPSQPTHITDASAASVERAVMAVGKAYGNNGDSPEHNTLILTSTNSLGMEAWPFAMYTFLMLRTSTTRLGPTQCAIANGTLDFFTFFYTNKVLLEHLPTIGWIPPPVDMRQDIVQQLRRGLVCDPTNSSMPVPVYSPPHATPRVRIVGPSTLQEIVKMHMVSFTALASSVSSEAESVVQFEFVPSATARQLVDTWTSPATSFGMIAFADENLSLDLMREDRARPGLNLVQIGYVGVGLGIVYNLCSFGEACDFSHIDLILTLELAAHILDGTVTWWNDTAIQALNPDVAHELPQQPITIITGPDNDAMTHEFVAKIRRCCDAGFDYDGGANGIVVAETFPQQRALMFTTPYSIGFTPLNMTAADSQVYQARIVNRAGEAVAPSAHAIEACGLDTFDSTSKAFQVDQSKHPECYPLVSFYNLITLQTYTRNESVACYEHRSRGFAFETAQFMAYLLSGEHVNKPTEEREIAVFDNLQVVPVGETELVDTFELVTVQVESITCGDVNPTSLVKLPHNLNHIPDALVYFVYALYGLMMLCFMGLSVWILVHRSRKLVRNSSPAFMLQVLFGAAVQISTVIPLSQQDDYMKDRAVTVENMHSLDVAGVMGLDVACAAAPILFTFGFFVLYSALFLKAWRLIRIFNNTKLRHLYVRDAQLFAYQAGVVVVVVGLNLTWVLTDPLHWVRTPIVINERVGLVVNSVGLCQCKTAASAIPLLLGVIGVLVVGNYLSYLGRHIPTEFNESRWTAMAMVVNLEAMLLGLPVLVLANDNPTTGYVIKVFILMLMAGATVGLVFLPKLALAYGWFAVAGDGSDAWRFVKGDSSGSGSAAAAGKAAAAAKSQNSKLNVAAAVGSTNPVLSGTGLHVGKTSTTAKAPSLASLVDNSFSSGSPSALLRPTAKAHVHNHEAGSPGKKGGTAAALTFVLEDDPMRRRFRRFLATLQADENVRFFDAVEAFKKDPESKRAGSARAILQHFVQDSAPKQINLKANTRSKLLAALRENQGLSDPTLFDGAMQEVLDDLKQSDAFQQYLSGGGGMTSSNLAGSGGGGESDVSLS